MPTSRCVATFITLSTSNFDIPRSQVTEEMPRRHLKSISVKLLKSPEIKMVHDEEVCPLCILHHCRCWRCRCWRCRCWRCRCWRCRCWCYRSWRCRSWCYRSWRCCCWRCRCWCYRSWRCHSWCYRSWRCHSWCCHSWRRRNPILFFSCLFKVQA